MTHVNFIQCVFIAMLMTAFHHSYAQKKWAGGNGSWDDASSWQPAAVPDSTDQVILDNSFHADSYTVSLPNHAVSVYSLVIAPGTNNKIELLLPVSNMSSPAFTAHATGDAIVIRSGGTFRNSAGINSGQSLNIKGLVRIESNGVYVHNTRSGHAADIVAKLSIATGTENGIFEFDVPGGSYPVSLSNRVYGTLVFSSAASGGTQTYNASGTNPLLVRSDMAINEGVILNIDFTKDITIMGSYRQQGGVFNVASQPNTNAVIIKGDLVQSAAGVITETSTGVPVIECNGSAQQRVSMQGSVTNQVKFRINNPSNVLLLHNLTVPYVLHMQQGHLITSSAAMLIVPDNGQITGASVQSFVIGPIRKTGDEAFEFPAGKQGDYAPVAISAGTAVTDEFVAEYFLGNPQITYGTFFDNAVIVRISALEYWRVEQTTGTSSRKITLSVGTYSHATAIDKLVVSRWDAGLLSWKNEGNAAFSGIATGQITSNSTGSFGAFTLASTVAVQNPLPVLLANFKVLYHNGQCTLHWQTADNMAARFEIEQSADQKDFIAVATVLSQPGKRDYQYTLPDNLQSGLFVRLKMIANDGTIHYSQIVSIKHESTFRTGQVHVSGNDVLLTVFSSERQWLQVVIADMSGGVVYMGKRELYEARNTIRCTVPGFARGIYLVRISDVKGRGEVWRFVKW